MTERLRILLVDFIALCCVWSLYYWFRIQSGWFAYSSEPLYWGPMVVLALFWMLLFFFFGLYRSWFAKSRFDEFIAVFKAATFGVLVLFFAIFIDDRGAGSPLQSRLMITLYWGLMILFVGGGRLLLHTFQRRLLEAGIGLRNTIIVGGSGKARELFDTVALYPALGHRLIGFVHVGSDDPDQAEYKGIPVLGSIRDLPQIIDNHQIRDVLIALESSEHDRLLSVIGSCNGHDVSMKIIPDLYDLITGQARTNQIYGFPLIEIMPEIMQPWERAVKRSIDIIVSFLILFFGLPVWLLVALAIRLESKGPVVYSQVRVGKDEKPFKILKFRSMYMDAEKHSGPVWAQQHDPRITKVGNFIRKARIDEIPQMINVLDGKMSLVGPRPERPYFVEQLSKEIPLYKRRLKVRPGITGWAQVKHKYDESIDDVRKKVEYDLSYIENMSLRMDLKILLNTISVVLLGKGH
jgi:exopolysaccharide biosynthesis polyprenyl glycosylphosphotransferase